MLDRTWYNTLVDDDGSGLVGSVWDKADVDALMDAIDAEIVRIDGLMGGGIMYPSIGSGGGGVPTYALINGRSQRIANGMIIGGKIVMTSKGSLANGLLLLQGLPLTSNATMRQGGVIISSWGSLVLATSGLQTVVEAGAAFAYFVYTPAGGATSQFFLDASHIGDTFEFQFGGTYIL